jgi:hypothetical protein
MEDCSAIKIWRYMDLAKFISLLATESLYFACPSEFQDPFEGYMPRSHIEAFSVTIVPMVQNIISIRNQLADKYQDIDMRQIDEKIDDLSLLEASREANRKFGVSCWHKSEYESEAAWKIYSTSGQGIAIESTVGQLQLSLENVKGLIIDSVRYMNFNEDPIEKGHKHYAGFLKRRSFEHEKELRATIPLSEAGKGVYVKCKLDTLITCIHISPFVPVYFKETVESLCLGKVRSLEKPVIQSKLLSNPDYRIKISK